MKECHEGSIVLEKDKFDMFCQNNSEPGCFTSPSSVCKIGHTQTFKLLDVQDEEEVTVIKVGDPVADIPATEEDIKDAAPVPTAIAVDDSPLEERLEKVCEHYNKLADSNNDLMNELKGRIVKLEKRVQKLEGQKKGPKVSRKEE